MPTRYTLYFMNANTNKIKTGGDVRKQAAYHPPPQQDLQFVFNCNEGVKQQSNLDRWLDNDVETGTIQPEGSAESISATC